MAEHGKIAIVGGQSIGRGLATLRISQMRMHCIEAHSATPNDYGHDVVAWHERNHPDCDGMNKAMFGPIVQPPGFERPQRHRLILNFATDEGVERMRKSLEEWNEIFPEDGLTIEEG